MTREGAPASLYVPGPGGSADSYNYNVFGGQQFFPFVLGVTEGNPNAQAESSDTYTLGFVMNVPKVDRLTLSLDWWSIKLTDAIGIPGHDTIYRQCLDAQYNSLIGSAPGSHTGAELAANNPFCALIQREYVGGAPLTPGNYGADRKYKAQYINQGGIETAGYDLVVDWRVGNFDVNFQGSLLDNYSEAAFPGAQFVDYTDTSYNNSFQYRTFTTVQYARNSFSVGVRWQHLPEIKPAPGSAPNVLGTDSHDQFDLFGAWRFKDRWQLRGGITNALNADPEVVLATTINHNLGSTNSNYDQVGRSVYLGLTVTL
jgi:outer membrane receptor protein involved in Fe transport